MCQTLSGADWLPLHQLDVSRVFTAFALLTHLDDFRQLFDDHLRPRPHLLVIDSLGGVIAPIVGSARGRGHEIMMQLLRTIKAIASKFDIAVLVRRHTKRQSAQGGMVDGGSGRGVPLLLTELVVFVPSQTTNYTVSSVEQVSSGPLPTLNDLKPALGQ